MMVHTVNINTVEQVLLMMFKFHKLAVDKLLIQTFNDSVTLLSILDIIINNELKY